jgi:molecular chaperone DnaK (HSP70)
LYRISDPEIVKLASSLPNTVVQFSDDDDTAAFELQGPPESKLQGKVYRGYEVSRFVLSDLKLTAERYLKTEVMGAVITVPGILPPSIELATTVN